MTGYPARDRIAIVAALAAPLLAFLASWSNTNVALLLIVVVVGVAAAGSRAAGSLAAVWAAIWFDFFFTVPFCRFTIRSSADVTTAVLLLHTGLVVSQLRTFGHGQYYGRFMPRPSRALSPRCKRALSPSRWPVRPDGRSVPPRPRGACPDEPARRLKTAQPLRAHLRQPAGRHWHRGRPPDLDTHRARPAARP
jgi:hypothetical protein